MSGSSVQDGVSRVAAGRPGWRQLVSQAAGRTVLSWLTHREKQHWVQLSPRWSSRCLAE